MHFSRARVRDEICVLLALLLPAAIACSDVLGYENLKFEDDGGKDGGGHSGGTAPNGGSPSGGAPNGGNATGGGANGGTPSGGVAGSGVPSGGTASGGSATGGSSTGGFATGGAPEGGAPAGGTGGSSDPLEAARQTCIDHINELRATKGRQPYARWTSIESCVDGQATYDSTHGPHAAFNGGNSCGASSQGECPGSGPNSVTSCIDLMWAEKDQSICSGCDACPSLWDGWNGNCPNCKVQSAQPTCGHYLMLVTASQSKAGCGFSTGSAYTAIDCQ